MMTGHAFAGSTIHVTIEERIEIISAAEAL
jgi:hypothetical protein